jgi:hypothetical protein
MPMKVSNRLWVYLATFISLAGVAIHVGVLFADPSWLAFFHAPPGIVASARNGTWLAPVGGSLIAALMGICAYYAASVLELVRRPPLQRLGLAVIASICLIRALLLPALAISHPFLRTDTFEIVAAIIWGLVGIGFAVGFRLAQTKSKRPANNLQPPFGMI